MCALLSIFFLGGWFTPISFFQMSCWFGFKLALLAFCFVWMSATYPSYSYECEVWLNNKNIFLFVMKYSINKWFLGYSKMT